MIGVRGMHLKPRFFEGFPEVEAENLQMLIKRF